MLRVMISVPAAVVLLLAQAFGQSSLLVGSVPGVAVPLGFAPSPNNGVVTGVSIAPGQIVTFQVTGLKTVLPAGQIVRATRVPVANTLSGISITVVQEPHGNIIEPAPILALSQVSYCGSSASPATCAENITYITVQIPFELSLTAPTLIGISENGVDSSPFPFNANPIADNIHVVTNCDTASAFNDFHSIVAHADGTVVSAASPAKPGEEIVIYAFGLGKVAADVKTGAMSPTPAATVVAPIDIQFDYRPNAGPSRPYTGVQLPSPLFAGLTPGQVALYQINLRLPGSFPSVPPCDQNSPLSGGSTAVVESNLTIDIGGPNSFDGAAICIAAAH